MDTPPPYTGPVPAVTHVHGAHTSEESDGYAEAWYLPPATDIPAGYYSQGSLYDEFRVKFAGKWGVDWQPGTATFHYPNDQRATTLWYHDHTLGMTRLNVYAGPAGFYIVRGGSDDLPPGVLPGPAPARDDPPGLSYFEIPIAIQDRWFNTDGSLWYPDSRAFFDGFEGPYIPFSDIAPIWNPEVFPNTMVVNGRTWPWLQVEPRRYRFRLLNGTNSRYVILKLVTGDPTVRPGVAALPFWQIGAEGGFLPAPVMLEQLLVSPAERADVIVDFTGLTEGTELFLINEGPDEPFGGGVPGVDFPFADPLTTGQVMKFVVGPLTGPDTSTPPNLLALPALTALGPANKVRQVSLNEEDSLVLPDVGPRAAELGTLDAFGNGVVKGWDEPLTEIIGMGDTEVWEMHNFTMDAHPIHIHQVMFEVVNRENKTSGVVRPPEAWETGPKDTVTAYPGEITRVKARFNLPGLYVWHCHIVEHEDNEMMRPYRVVQRAYLPLITKG
jgi:bilirubin oxidase